MIKLKDFMESVGHRISEGSNYLWDCYGSNAYMLDSWNNEHDGHSATIIFDTRTQEVYEVQLHDYANNVAYRMINPAYEKKHRKEAKHKSVLESQAWDDVNYTEISDEEEFLGYIQDTFKEVNEDDDSFTMPMPGTIGGAKITFKEDNMETYNVNLDVRYILEVKANSMDDAVRKARYFQETMPTKWGDTSESAVCWVDTYIVKEQVEKEINV